MGRVVQAGGPPYIDMPGVSVHIKGTEIGAVTGDQGLYIIRPDQYDTLVFSYVGYVTQEIPINNKTVINVEMVPEE